MKWYKYNGFICYGQVNRDWWNLNVPTSHCLNGGASDKFEWKYMWVPDEVCEKGEVSIRQYITINAESSFHEVLLKYGEVDVYDIEETEDVPVEVITKEYEKYSVQLNEIMQKLSELMQMKLKVLNNIKVEV